MTQENVAEPAITRASRLAGVRVTAAEVRSDALPGAFDSVQAMEWQWLCSRASVSESVEDQHAVLWAPAAPGGVK
jgi:hypothetical protein